MKVNRRRSFWSLTKQSQTVRYMGICSARTRGAAKSTYSFINAAVTDIDKPKPSKSWAACMKQIFEFDPLECPKCGSTMKIKSFITDSNEIRKITAHHMLPAWRAPPRRLSENSTSPDFFTLVSLLFGVTQYLQSFLVFLLEIVKTFLSQIAFLA